MRPCDSTGLQRPFTGSCWTGWVKRDIHAGFSRARARDIARVAPRTAGPDRTLTGAARSLGPPTVLPCACSRRNRSRLASRCERVQPTGERLQAEAPFRPGADSSEPTLLRAEAARLPPARSFPYLPRLGLSAGGRQSGFSTPRRNQYPNTCCQYPDRAKG
jgi:hypothetical protein